MTQKIEADFSTNLELWRSGSLNDGAMALHYFLFYYFKKNPSKKLALSLENANFTIQTLKQFQFKKVRQKALIALSKWINNEWEFHLSEKIYTPIEVLDFQCSGIRPVTMKIQDEFNPILHKEDCLEFFLHDLEHGYMFNFGPELREMQIAFFNKIRPSLHSEIWNKYFARDQFIKDFHYLISDMNTHIEHYKKYLYAKIDKEDESNFSFLFDA